MIPFNQVPVEAWEESQAKWVRCLLHNTCNWNSCSVCDYMFSISPGKRCSTGASGCPLIVSNWCCAWEKESKLSSNCEIDNTPWETRVENYLWWIDLEIEAMNGW